jgi:hypothetical protein
VALYRLAAPTLTAGLTQRPNPSLPQPADPDEMGPTSYHPSLPQPADAGKMGMTSDLPSLPQTAYAERMAVGPLRRDLPPEPEPSKLPPRKVSEGSHARFRFSSAGAILAVSGPPPNPAPSPPSLSWRILGRWGWGPSVTCRPSQRLISCHPAR